MRLIDADALIEILKQWQRNAEKSRPDDVGLKEFNHGVMGLAQAAVAQMPTITLDDLRPKGKWKIVKDDYDCELMRCSVCREEFYDGDNDTVDCMYNYCPNCGAKMEAENESPCSL